MTTEELRLKLVELSGQCDMSSREQIAVNGVLCVLISTMFDNSQADLLRYLQPYINAHSEEDSATDPDRVM